MTLIKGSCGNLQIDNNKSNASSHGEVSIKSMKVKINLVFSIDDIEDKKRF